MLQWMPCQLTLLIFRLWCSGKTSDQKDKSKPIFTILSKPLPIDRAAQSHINTDQAGFFSNFTTHAFCNILTSLHLAAESVVFSQMLVFGPGRPVHQQNTLFIRGKNIAKGSQYRCIHNCHITILLCRQEKGP